MIISTISKGSLAAGDKPAVRGAPEKIPRILDGFRYQIRLTIHLIAVVNTAQIV